MGVGMSGLVSNLDTDTIVKAMVSRYTTRKENYQKEQTKLEWQQDIWKELNTKIYNFYSKTLSDLRFTDAYNQKTTSISDPTIATITTDTASVLGTQSLAVRQLAKSGYLTGGKVSTGSGIAANKDTTLESLGISTDTTLNLSTGSSSKAINLTSSMTVKELVSALNSAGVSASFDETNQRFFIWAKESGASNDFSLAAASSSGIAALKSLGLYTGTSSSDLEYYKTWNSYSQTDIDNLIATTASAKYTNVDTESTLLINTNKSLVATNEELTKTNGSLEKQIKFNNYGYAYSELYIGSDWASEEKVNERAEYYNNVKSQADALNAKVGAGETLTDEEQSTLVDLNLQLGAIEQVDAAMGSDTLTNEERTAYRENLMLGITSTQELIDENVAAIAENQATIAENEAIIAGTSANTTLEEIVQEKNAATLQSVTEEINAKWETAKAYMVQYNYLHDSGSGITEEEYNAAVAAIGDIQGSSSGGTAGAVRIEGQDAIIELNGAQFQSNSNTFTINGLTITAQEATGQNADGTYKTVSLTTSTDVSGIYDKIRNFFSEYNKLIKEMDTLYNAKSSKGYEPLTDDDKESMSDSEIEKWEKKIKDSLLRRDDTLDTVSYTMKNAISEGVEVNGKTYYLSSFGIGTMSYFLSSDNEKGAFHIDGDSEDTSVSNKKDKLKTAIATDPDTVMAFFTGMTSNLYDALSDKMKSTTLRSAYTVYNDKQMASDYKEYTDKISDVQDEIEYWEDFYYRKFTAMETALSKLNSSTSALSSMLGGN